jgi:hypothetical protein
VWIQCSCCAVNRIKAKLIAQQRGCCGHTKSPIRICENRVRHSAAAEIRVATGEADVVFNFAQFFSSRIDAFFARLPNSGVSMAIGASFEQFEKSNGGACKPRLDYRPLSHNQAFEIDRLKQALKSRQKVCRKLSGTPALAASTSDQNVSRLRAARIISNHHRTRFVQPDQTNDRSLCSTAPFS